MLNPLDDFAVHQTPEPLAHTATADANAYDRYFFNGYDDAGDVVFAAALGVYPNRRIIDAAITVVHQGRQRSLHASGRMPVDRTVTRIGPISVEVVEPLAQLRLSADAADLGFDVDVTFHATTPAVEEPRYQWRIDQATFMDLTRMTQFGRWSGSITVDGTRHAIEPDRFRGCRDRSWGVRPVGDQPRAADRHELPQFFWLWAPINLDDGGAVHLDVNEHGDGRRWHQAALLVPALGDDATPDDRFDPDAAEVLPGLRYAIDWAPGTRRARSASFDLVGLRGEQHVLELEPVSTLLMKGLGYTSPDWPHGGWKGELAVGSESWLVDELDPTDLTNVHVQQVSRARVTGPDGATRTGVGVLEFLAINAHEPSGLQGFSDGFAVTSMRAWRVHELGPPLDVLRLEHVEVPQPADGQVSIAVSASALNFADSLLCEGTYQEKPSLPFTPGMEVAGTVVSAPDDSGLAPGQRVIALPALPHGGLAERTIAAVDDVFAIPDSIDDPSAAALLITYQTGWFGLYRRAQLQAGETVLVHAGAGGVGSAAIQLAKARGARVVATAGGPDKVRLCVELGADVAVDYRADDFVAVTNEVTDGRGADVIFDSVGGDTFDRSRKCIAFEGRLVVVGFAGGRIPEAPANHLLVKNYGVIGLHLGLYRRRRPDLVRACHAELMALHEAGRIAPLIGAVRRLDEAPTALTDLTERATVGKIVLVP